MLGPLCPGLGGQWKLSSAQRAGVYAGPCVNASPDGTGSKRENRRSDLESRVPGPKGCPGAQATRCGVHSQVTFRYKKALESRELGEVTWSGLARPRWRNKPMAIWRRGPEQRFCLALAVHRANTGSLQVPLGFSPTQTGLAKTWIDLLGTAEVLLARAWL